MSTSTDFLRHRQEQEQPEQPQPEQPQPPRPNGHAPRGKQFGKLTVLAVTDIDTATPRSYLLKGLISPNEISLWVGPPKCGKSFLMLHIAYLLSLGLSVFGRRVKPARVLYVAAEGEQGIINRIEALRRAYGESANFSFIAQRVDLLHPYGHLEDLKLAANGRDLVVLDTLSRVLAGGDENHPKDMGTIIDHITELRHDTNAHIAIVHHGNRASNGTSPRGHSSLDGATDVLTEITKNKDTGLRTARVVHAKDDPDGYAFTFMLDLVELGTDADGDPINTLIVRETNEPAQAKDSRKNGLSANDRIALRCLEAAPRIAATVGDNHATRPVCRESEWRNAFYMQGRPGDDTETKRKAYNRAKNVLIADGIVKAQDNLVWHTDW
jgi:hypothetical protein